MTEVSTAETSPPDLRLRELDAIRGIACLSVMLWHYCYWYGQNWGHTTAPLINAHYGNFGVQMFFILSGFVILMTWERTQTSSQFLIARLGRLFPPYWVVLVLLYPVTRVLPLTPVVPVHDTVMWSEFWWNFTMLPTVFGARYVDSAHWSLGFELMFYCWMALGLSMRVRRARTVIIVFSIWTIVAIGWGEFIQSSGLPTWKTIFWHDALGDWRFIITKVFLLPYVNLFLIGLSSYTLWTKRHTALSVAGILLGIAADLPIWGREHAVCVAVLTTSFLFVLGVRPRVLRIRPLVILGEISYSLYLVHQDLGFRIIQQLERRGVSADFAIATAVLVSIAAAFLLHHAIERPTHAYFKKLSKQRAIPAAPLPADHVTHYAI